VGSAFELMPGGDTWALQKMVKMWEIDIFRMMSG
jgi:hypothetical protein